MKRENRNREMKRRENVNGPGPIPDQGVLCMLGSDLGLFLPIH
jgi:hypothetical protein